MDVERKKVKWANKYTDDQKKQTNLEMIRHT